MANTDVKQSPISRLPDELLSLVLQTAVEDYECDIMPSEPLSWFLLSVTRVSKQWRRISKDSPRLWKNIWHNTTEEDVFRVGAPYYPSTVCIERSLAAPLNVFAFGVASAAQELFGQLRTAEVEERVRNLFLDRVWSLAMAYDSDLVFTNLESLGASISQNRRTVFPDFLLRCSNINRFHLDCASPAAVDPSIAFSGVVHLPKLTDLRLLWARASVVERILSVISAPKLVELTLMFRVVPYHSGNILLGESHTLRQLRVLTIGGRCISENIIGILRYTPCLQDLRFHTILHGKLDDLLDNVRSRGDLEGLAFPELRTLSIHGCRMSLHGVLRFLDSQIGASVRVLGLSRTMLDTYPTTELEGITYRVELYEWFPPGLHYSPRQSRDALVPLSLTD